jgi:hypothetical protein
MQTIKMNTEREILTTALRELSKSSRRNKTAQLREIFDEVESAKAAGVSNKVIVETLQKNGIFYDVNNFKNARSRILKERALATLQNQSLPETAKPPAIDQVATRKLAKLEVKTVDAQATETGGIKTLSSEDIKELSKKEIDLSDYQ